MEQSKTYKLKPFCCRLCPNKYLGVGQSFAYGTSKLATADISIRSMETYVALTSRINDFDERNEKNKT